jgi:uncharacterized protein (UPF0210 family)
MYRPYQKNGFISQAKTGYELLHCIYIITSVKTCFYKVLFFEKLQYRIDFIGGFTALVEKGIAKGDRSLIKAILEALAETQRVCSVGLDMVAIPGETSEETIAAIIADEMAIGVINKKTTAARLIPVPGKKAGDKAYFGSLLGQSVILPVNNATASNRFTRFGGRIPAPIQSQRN